MSKVSQISVSTPAAILVVLLTTHAASAVDSQSGAEKFASDRVSIDHARVARQKSERRPSLMSTAIEGRLLTEVPEAPLDGTLVEGNVEQAGFFDGHRASCGPVCGCESCAEPVCGVEVGCGLDPGCGIEPGCGIDGCCDCEAACGIEAGCGFDPACEVGCGYEVAGDCGCDACCPEIDKIPFCLPLLRVNWNRFDFFAGVQGYKGPMNFADTGGNQRDGSGSFGFYQGFNEGRSLKRLFGWDFAAQFGVRATQNNLSGASFTSDSRNQVFVTGGWFRRVDYGMQYGMVIDYLNDDWYFQGDLVQLRGELSWRAEGCYAWGFQYHAGVRDDSSATQVRDGAGGTFNSTVNFEPTDQYRFFYRRLLRLNGQCDAFAGWTDSEDGILGANLTLPLRRHLVLSTAATYLIPSQGTNSGGHEEESWNIALGLIYRVGGPNGCGRYCRPMFDVADNGTFMVDRK